jgi:hypothetical protein
MLMKRGELLGSHTLEREILAYFAHKQHSRISSRLSDAIRAVDEWWYVPRSNEAREASKKRRRIAVRQYRLHGTLPEWCHAAYRYARGARYQSIEARYRAKQIGGWEQYFKVALFVGVEEMIPSKV